MKNNAWNKGKIVGQKSPFTATQTKLIKSLLSVDNKSLRDLALFSTGIDTMLRASDLLRLTVDDVTDYQGNIKDEFLIRQQKTGQGNLVMLSDYTQKILSKWIGQTNKVKAEFLFTRIRKDTGDPITSTQYRRLVKKWASLARIDPETVSTHSLRRTKASIIFAKTGNIECIRQLLGQKSVTSTSHYLDLSKKESIAIAREIEL